MRGRAARIAIVSALLLSEGAASAQNEWREFPSIERGWRASTEWNHDEHGEFVVGRLMFPQSATRGVLGSDYGDWLQGGTAWTVDYPEGDRRFAQLLARLTRMDVRVVEQPVNLDDGIDAFYWPFLISGLVGAWDLTDEQTRKLREYLLRGGFLLCDSFYGDDEWAGFIDGMSRVFPDRPIVELPADHPIFHVVFDLTERPRIPTWQHLPYGGYRGGPSGSTPHWRAILDDDDRVMVMITYNNDIADGWQRADMPQYPPDAAYLAIALGVNFAVYALTH
jgi:hypothetical protein